MLRLLPLPPETTDVNNRARERARFQTCALFASLAALDGLLRAVRTMLRPLKSPRGRALALALR